MSQSGAAETREKPKAERSSGGRAWLALAIALMFMALGYVGYRLMQRDALATLTQFTGQTERDTAAAMLQWRAAQVGADFDVGDGARTAENSIAQFRLINGARLELKASSQIRFQQRTPEGPLKVDVDVGQADVQSGAGAVTIDSEFGEITLDANSSVNLRREGARLNVDVELGGIQLSERRVEAGDGIELELGGIVVDVPPEAKTVTTAEPVPDAGAVQEPPLVVGDGVTHADLVVRAGESFVVHDPSPPSAIGMNLRSVCEGPARLVSGKQRTEADGQAKLSFAKGKHSYSVYCLDAPEKVAASGSITVLHDAGTRKLPTFTPTASVTTDGRRYTVMYQHKLPRVTVSWPTAPQAEKYSLRIGGRTIKTNSPRHTFASLPRGKHRVVFSAETAPARQSRATTIEVLYDRQAPTARVSSPSLEFEHGESVTLSGQALSGWEVSVDGARVNVDEQQRFSVEVAGRKSIPIAFTHPSKGTHYYLRRSKAQP